MINIKQPFSIGSISLQQLPRLRLVLAEWIFKFGLPWEVIGKYCRNWNFKQFGDILAKPNLLASSQVDQRKVHYSVKDTYGNTSPKRDVNGFVFWGAFLCDYLWL